MRHIVVKTGGWFDRQKVLLSPVVIDYPNWVSEMVPVELTKNQVQNSPDIDTEKPVSRQAEEELYAYYNWSPYWTPAGLVRPGLPPRTPPESTVATPPQKEEDVLAREANDPTLRSTDEVTGYYIHATDGDIGHVEDFLVDDEHWFIRYMIVDTRNWLPGRKVIVSPEWIENVVWAKSQVLVNLTRDTIKNSPEYDPAQPVTREYEAGLYSHYGRPFYWT